MPQLTRQPHTWLSSAREYALVCRVWHVGDVAFPGSACVDVDTLDSWDYDGWTLATVLATMLMCLPMASFATIVFGTMHVPGAGCSPCVSVPGPWHVMATPSVGALPSGPVI